MSRFLSMYLIAFVCFGAVGCGGGVEEVPAVTTPGENASEAENKKRMEDSMKMGGRQEGQ